jgi:predicted transposase/invertase (TIGR01784 family)
LREDLDHDIVLTDALEIHFINMVQYRKQAGNKSLDDPLNRWMAWLDGKSPPDLIAEVLKMDSAINAANEKLDLVTMDEEVLRYYHLRQMALSDYTSAIDYAREEGLAEGLEKGREEVARNALAQGASIDFVNKITGLDIETIKQLANKS